MAERRLVLSLTAAIALQWTGASAIVPLLPDYLRLRGGSNGAVGLVMASYFAAALLSQYPAGRLADRRGRLPVLLGGLVLYAAGSAAFLTNADALADVAFRALQGAGAGAAEVAALAMVASAVPLERRGRAFGSVYGAQLAGMAVGPLLGSLIGVSAMNWLFLMAGLAALLAGIPVAIGARHLAGARQPPAGARTGSEKDALRTLLRGNRALVGAVLCALAIGITTGVYETCWTLLLNSRHAATWQIGLSWTMFAVPFVALARFGGWLADRADRRVLVVVALLWSAAFCLAYPFIPDVAVLVGLGALEAVGFALALPAAQSLLGQDTPPSVLGRAQGMFATAETGSTAMVAAVSGVLFSVGRWVPYVAGALGSSVFVLLAGATWRPVVGRVRDRRPAPQTELPPPGGAAVPTVRAGGVGPGAGS